MIFKSILLKKSSHGVTRCTEDTEMNENEIGTIIVNTAFYLHKNLGPGLLESVYETIINGELD